MDSIYAAVHAVQLFFMTAPADPQGVAQSLWLIIALPILGAILCGLFGKWLGRANVHLIACGMIAGALALSLIVFWTLNDRSVAMATPFGVDKVPYAIGYDYGTWFKAGGFVVHFGLLVDHLSVILLLVITGVGFLIHLYSTSYMSHDPAYARYFAYLNLFVANMLVLVMADNLLLTFVGWEGVGLCSYLLIGFWYTDPAKAFAGRKAFIANRVGDFAFIVGMALLTIWIGAFAAQAKSPNFGAPAREAPYRAALAQVGSLNYQGLEVTARSIAYDAPGRVTMSIKISDGPLKGATFGDALTAILLLFMLGAAGKSAQIPLYVWLPDAMAGPTPVSALIHAATMVTAGVYLFSRLNFLLVFSPLAMSVVALIGAATALFAALIAFAQDDIKKVLAYSTISQLGFMFMAVGMGVYWAAVLHLVTHAFFKACLFLGAGSVMHGNADETDIKKLGGLRKEMPLTWVTFGIATLAITGIVPLSGFFSKDAILHGIHETSIHGFEWVSPWVWGIGLAAAFCTAFYMTRLYVLTFEGSRSPNAKVPHAHESDWPITTALMALATLSVAALFYGIPLLETSTGAQPVMENFLTPVLYTGRQILHVRNQVTVEEGTSIWLAWGEAWAIALMAGGLAWWLYLRYFPAHAGQPAPAILLRVRSWAQHKFYVDELYELLILRPLKFLSIVLYKVVDGLLIDTLLVRGSAWVTSRVGSVLRYFQTGDAQSYAAVMAIALACSVAYAFFALK